MTKLDSRLQQALEQIEAGIEPAAAITAVSAGLPASEAAELTELIRLAVALRELPAPQPARMGLPASVVNAARDLRAAQSKPTGWWERLKWRELASQAYVIGFAVLMLAIFTAVFILPGVIEQVIGQPTPTISAPTAEASPATDLPAPTSISGVTPTQTSTVEPTSSMIFPPPLFELPLAPIIAHGSDRDWDASYTDPGAVIVMDDRLVMFRNGSAESLWPTHYMTGLSTSETGRSWQELSGPVFKSEAVPYSNVAALVTGAVAEPDGSISIYFYTYTAISIDYATSFIGRAHAPTLEGTYTVNADPVLRPGAAGAWDDFAVRNPSVIRTEAGYLMAYTGINTEQQRAIGMATSPDGIIWTKYNDPSTDGVYAESDPVLTPQADAWDADYVFSPSLVQTDTGMLMMYRGAPGRGEDKNLLGLAMSEDGLTWQRYERNPVLDVNVLSSEASLEHFTMVYYRDALYIYLEVFMKALPGSNIWMAANKGELP